MAAFTNGSAGTALQFGHGGEAVETGDTIDVLFGATTLQFGHGGEAVETTILPTHGNRAERCFNSATAVKPWRHDPGNYKLIRA